MMDHNSMGSIVTKIPWEHSWWELNWWVECSQLYLVYEYQRFVRGSKSCLEIHTSLWLFNQKSLWWCTSKWRVFVWETKFKNSKQMLYCTKNYPTTATKQVVICIPWCHIPVLYQSKVVISCSLWYWKYHWYNEKSRLPVHIPVFLYSAHIPKSLKSDQKCSVIVNYFVNFGILSIYQTITNIYQIKTSKKSYTDPYTKWNFKMQKFWGPFIVFY